MRRQYGKFGLSLALAGLVMMAFALWGAQSVVHRLQYVVLAPVLASGAQGSSEGAEGAADQQPGSDAESDSNDADDAEGANEVDAPNELTQALSALYNALSGLELHAGVCGEVNGFSIEGEGGRSEKATLHATDERWFELYPKALLYGRTIAAGEFTSGARIALLDQELAFRLFGISDPINRQIQLGDAQYRVVGVVRHARVLGERDPYGAYIPLSNLGPIQLQTLTVSAASDGGSFAAAQFESVMRIWNENGDFYDLPKEITRATLLARYLLTLAGALMIARAFRWLRELGGYRMEAMRTALTREYAVRLAPRMACEGALIALGYGALCLASYALAAYLVKPVYRFPEWVPSIIVEWSQISKVFWGLVEQAAKPIRLNTPESIRLAHCSTFMHWGTILGLLGLLCARNPAHRKQRVKGGDPDRVLNGCEDSLGILPPSPPPL